MTSKCNNCHRPVDTGSMSVCSGCGAVMCVECATSNFFMCANCLTELHFLN